MKRVDLEKTLLRKVGEAIPRFKMIRDGDRVAVALSGGKDSVTLLEALLLLQKRAPIDFSVCAFTVEQGKFLRPIEPLGEYLKQRGIPWTYYRDAPSLPAARGAARPRLRPVQPLPPPRRIRNCARARRQRDRLRPHRRRFLRGPAAQHDVHRQAQRAAAGDPLRATGDYRLIRPLVFVTEDITRAYAGALGVPVVPCGCSQRTGHRAALAARHVRRAGTGVSAPQGEHPFRHGKRGYRAAAGSRASSISDAERRADELFPIVTEL